MKVTAKYNGANITIANVEVNGQMVYLTYTDASGNLNVDKIFLAPAVSTLTIATSATVVS